MCEQWLRWKSVCRLQILWVASPGDVQCADFPPVSLPHQTIWWGTLPLVVQVRAAQSRRESIFPQPLPQTSGCLVQIELCASPSHPVTERRR